MKNEADKTDKTDNHLQKSPQEHPITHHYEKVEAGIEVSCMGTGFRFFASHTTEDDRPGAQAPEPEKPLILSPKHKPIS